MAPEIIQLKVGEEGVFSRLAYASSVRSLSLVYSFFCIYRIAKKMYTAEVIDRAKPQDPLDYFGYRPENEETTSIVSQHAYPIRNTFSIPDSQYSDNPLKDSIVDFSRRVYAGELKWSRLASPHRSPQMLEMLP